MPAVPPPRCPSCGQAGQVRPIGEVFDRWPRSRELARRYDNLDPWPPLPPPPRRPCSCGCLVVNLVTLSLLLVSALIVEASVLLGYGDRTVLLIPLLLWLGPFLLGLRQARRRRRRWRSARGVWNAENAEWRAQWYCWLCDASFVPLPPLPDNGYTGQTIHITS